MNTDDLENLQNLYKESIHFLTGRNAAYDVFSYDQESLKMMGISDFINMQTDYLVEEFMEGPEISVDALVQGGVVTIFGIEDQIRMQHPYFMQIAGRMPFICSPEKYKSIEQIITQTIQALGIKNSATHTEIIFTKEGPKVVEIGCRIGGDDLLETIYQVTGYNLLYELVLILLAKKREYKKVETMCHMFSEFILPKKKGIIRKINIPNTVQNDIDVIDVVTYLDPGNAVALIPEAFDYIGYVSVRGNTPEAAEKKMRKTLQKITIIIDE
jgi:biotin carboxylase